MMERGLRRLRTRRYVAGALSFEAAALTLFLLVIVLVRDLAP